MIRSSILALAISAATLLLAIPGCAPVSEERPTTPAVPAPRPRLADVPRKSQVAFVFQEIEGAEAARTRAVFAPIEARVSECRPGKGVVHVRLVSKRGQTSYSVEPKTSLVGYERRCVLETLSTVELEGISGDASPSARPPGFTALFSIEW
jgi:hypothetical protein